VLAFSTQFRRFKPGRSRRIFQGEKILSMTSFGGEVKPSVPRRRFAACKISLKQRGTRYFRPNDRTFLVQQVSHFAARISSVVVTWGLLAMKVGTLNTHGGMYNKPTGCSTLAFGAPHSNNNSSTRHNICANLESGQE
jgi:hypothetical protein